MHAHSAAMGDPLRRGDRCAQSQASRQVPPLPRPPAACFRCPVPPWPRRASHMLRSLPQRLTDALYTSAMIVTLMCSCRKLSEGQRHRREGVRVLVWSVVVRAPMFHSPYCTPALLACMPTCCHDARPPIAPGSLVPVLSCDTSPTNAGISAGKTSRSGAPR
jgi:hypothetical protein